jgi:uncharacterized membrane protein HdeD (DUF308 family)
MIQIIGLIIAVYTIARCIAEVTARPDGATSTAGKIAYTLCGVVTLILTAVLLAPSSTHVPRLP